MDSLKALPTSIATEDDLMNCSSVVPQWLESVDLIPWVPRFLAAIYILVEGGAKENGWKIFSVRGEEECENESSWQV